MTSPVPQTPEPTDERDLWAGIAVNRGVGISDAYDIADALLAHHARALAAAVQQERDKVLAVAEEMEQQMVDNDLVLVSGAYYASRIREVSR